MRPFSTCRALIHWQGLLLAVSLLNFWCLANRVYFGGYLTNAMVGDDVILHVGNNSPSAGMLMWFRASFEDQIQTVGVIEVNASSPLECPTCGRVTLISDGSLLIKNVTKNDTGVYTIVNYRSDDKEEIGYRGLKVYESVRRPTLLASNTIVRENDPVVLTCYTNVSHSLASYRSVVSIRWYFGNTKLQFKERMKLSKDLRNLTINPAKREDAGYYKCEAYNPVSSANSSLLQLRVKFG